MHSKTKTTSQSSKQSFNSKEDSDKKHSFFYFIAKARSLDFYRKEKRALFI